MEKEKKKTKKTKKQNKTKQKRKGHQCLSTIPTDTKKAKGRNDRVAANRYHRDSMETKWQKYPSMCSWNKELNLLSFFFFFGNNLQQFLFSENNASSEYSFTAHHPNGLLEIIET